MGKKPGALEVSEIGRNMEWRVVVNILTVKNFLQKQFCLMFKLLDNSFVIVLGKEMFEFAQNVFVFSWVESRIFFIFELLKLEEKVLEFFCGGNFVDFNRQ